LPALALAAAAVVGFLVTSTGPVTAVLGSALPRWGGRLSYGIYLWHFPIVEALTQHHLGGGSASRFAVTVALAVPLAAASFFLVERPMQRRLRPRVAAPSAARPPDVITLPA
jgi:peptidoglycan/LPS O-acetylase OafA/YrhL